MSTEQPRAPVPPGATDQSLPVPRDEAILVHLPPLPQPPPPVRWGLLFNLILGGLVVLLGLFLAAFSARNADLWMHLATGKLLVQGKYHFNSDSFSHVTVGAAWVNHSWLYDLLSYLAFSAGGGVALGALKAVVVGLVGLALLRASSLGRGLWGPALASGLALLALGLRVPLGPVCLSYLGLALTVGILERGLRRQESAAGSAVAAYWPLLPLFALWVNLDAWFVLGPAAVALYAVGALLRGERRAATGLGVALLAGTAACLLNPHGARAFAWPNDLGLSPAAAALSADPLGRDLVLSPLGGQFLGSGLARSPAGAAYVALALLGAVSFVVNLRGRPWPRLLLWAALLALSLCQWRAIPFFAVVAGPVLALNLQEAARRAEEARRAPARPVAPELLGFTVVVGVLVLVAAWPGWLQPPAEQPPPYEPRRLGVEAEPSLERAAGRLAEWRRDGRLGEGDLGLNFSPDAAAYFAWLCPEEKGFLDGRLPLFSAEAAADYAAVRRALLGDDVLLDRDWREVLRRRHVNHVILYDRDGERLAPALARLYRDPHEWPLLYEDGRTVIFGWRDPEAPPGPDPFAGMGPDFERAAYHPDRAEDKAPGAWPGRAPEPPGWLDAFTRSRPRRSLDRDEAGVYLVQWDALAANSLPRYTRAVAYAWVGAVVGGAGGTAPPVVIAPGVALRLRLSGAVSGAPPAGEKEPEAPLDVLSHRLADLQILGRDDAPASLLLLATRAARRALAQAPDDATAYFLLGEAYLRLANGTPERVWSVGMRELRQLRQVQASAAFNQAVLLRPDHLAAHERLARLYGDMNFDDLRLKHLKEVQRLAHAARPNPREPAARRAERLAALDEEVRRLDDQVRRALDEFESSAPNLRVLDRAQAAYEKHLAGKALEVLQGSDYAAFGAPGMLMELQLMLKTGRVREVREWMEPEQKEAVGEPNYAWLQAQLKAATGDYDAADADLMALGEAAPARPGPGERAPLSPREAVLAAVRDAVATGPLGDPTPAGVARPLAVWPPTWFVTNILGQEIAHRQDVTVVRGLLALEAGEADKAEALFRQAVALWRNAGGLPTATGFDFAGRPIAQEYLRRMAAAR